LIRRASPLTLAIAVLACGSRTDPGLLESQGDAAAGIDASPGADAPALLDVVGPCNGGKPSEIVYALDGSGVLYRYDPHTGATMKVGAPDCGNPNVPWTVTISPTTAYIVYTDWTLYAVDLATLACAPTPFQSGQLGLDAEFGVAIAETAAGEKLYVYGLPSGGPGPILAVTDTSSFVLTKVGDILPAPPATSFPVNLTADTSGHLYAYSPLGLVQEIDQATGSVLQAVDTGVATTSTWATITYGTELYLWAGSHVIGYDLAAHRRTSDREVGVAAEGAGSFPACVGP